MFGTLLKVLMYVMAQAVVPIEEIEEPLVTKVWTPTMEKFARSAEREYDLPTGICRAFALQESGYNPIAERVEANYVEKTGTYAARVRADAYKFAKARNWQPSVLTEIYQRGKSVTLFQIMGVNMRDMGYDEPFLNHVALTDQFKYFGIFVSRLLKKHKGNLGFAASEYNGGGGAVRGGNYRNPEYVKNILRYRQRFAY